MPKHPKKTTRKADTFASSKGSTANMLKSFRQSRSLDAMDQRMAAGSKKKSK